MHPQDAIELARNVQPLDYHQSLTLTDGLVFISCADCGCSFSLHITNMGPTTQRLRLLPEHELTDATREREPGEPRFTSLPLYRELATLRERCAQQEAELKELRQYRPHVESADCWCCPTLEYVDGSTGVAQYVHHKGN